MVNRLATSRQLEAVESLIVLPAERIRKCEQKASRLEAVHSRVAVQRGSRAETAAC